MKMNWLTVRDNQIEKEHATYADAVAWAQGTHCTDDRPHKEGDAYVLRRTTILKVATWKQWKEEA
jgi:hypothetical protein